jgi:hypothetical protein
MLASGEPLPAAGACGRIVIIQKPGYAGETAGGIRLLDGFSRAGCECCLCGNVQQSLLNKINPSFAVALHHSIRIPSNINSAVVIAHDRVGSIDVGVANFDCILCSMADADKLAKKESKKGRKLRAITFFPSVRATEFFDGPKERLAYVGVNWDGRRRNTYRRLWQLLDKAGYADVYGPSSVWSGVMPNSWRGFVGWENEGLLKKLQEAGIVLVLHADLHLNTSTPAWRIFEAAASSAVIICDRHKFVEENFKNSVLYVDQNAGPDEMFRQIDCHVKWIKSHPNEAKELAMRAHEIFLKKFTLEGEVGRALQLFREISAAKVEPTNS